MITDMTLAIGLKPPGAPREGGERFVSSPRAPRQRGSVRSVMRDGEEGQPASIPIVPLSLVDTSRIFF